MSYATILILREVLKTRGIAAAVIEARAYGMRDPAEFVAMILR